MLAKDAYIFLLLKCITSAVGYTKEAETDTKKYDKTNTVSQ